MERMFVTGPDVVKTVTNEVVTQEELGGAITHTTKSGVADVAFENDIDALLATREFFDFLPLSNRHDLPERPSADSWDRGDESLDTLIPPSANQPYDMGRADIKVVAGGVIPPQDYALLRAAGVQAIFGPGTNLADAADEVLRLLGHNRPPLDEAAE